MKTVIKFLNQAGQVVRDDVAFEHDWVAAYRLKVGSALAIKGPFDRTEAVYQVESIELNVTLQNQDPAETRVANRVVFRKLEAESPSN